MRAAGAGEDRRDEPAVLRAALEVARHLEVDECLGALVREAAELAGGGAVHAYRYSGSGFDLELVASTLDSGEALHDRLELLDARVLDDEVPLDGRRLDEAGLLEPAGGWGGVAPGSALALPLVAGEERVGLILVLDPPPAERCRDLEALVRECGPALRSALVVADLKDLMIRDDTADCYNRRYFDEHLTGEVARAVRFGGRLALIFLDLDNLKDVNTRHGHTAGSQVLYEVSVRINRTVRSVDKVFRFGGDEFCVVLPETGASGAREVAERVRRELAARPFLTDATAGEAITASFGISAFPDQGRTAAALVEAADRAMRRIKDGGKNAIALAGRERAGEPGR